MAVLRTKRALTAIALSFLGAIPLLAQTQNFAVDFSWSGTSACFDPKSPPFTLSGVPAGTKQLTFAMKDLDVPGFTHGGGNIPYSGQTQIARGAFTYKGPCPPQGQHIYQWTVEAQDGAGKTLATATAARKFPER